MDDILDKLPLPTATTEILGDFDSPASFNNLIPTEPESKIELLPESDPSEISEPIKKDDGLIQISLNFTKLSQQIQSRFPEFKNKFPGENIFVFQKKAEVLLNKSSATKTKSSGLEDQGENLSTLEEEFTADTENELSDFDLIILQILAMYDLTDFVSGPESVQLVLMPQHAIISDLDQIHNEDQIMLQKKLKTIDVDQKFQETYQEDIIMEEV